MPSKKPSTVGTPSGINPYPNAFLAWEAIRGCFKFHPDYVEEWKQRIAEKVRSVLDNQPEELPHEEKLAEELVDAFLSMLTKGSFDDK